MNRFFIVLLCLHFSHISAQDYVDTIPKPRRLYFGIEQRNVYDTRFGNTHQWENSISPFIKLNEYSFSLGFSLLSGVKDGNYVKKTIPGGCIGVGIDLYSYKDRLYLPIHFSYAYYRHTYTFEKDPHALLTANSLIARLGPEYVFEKIRRLHCFANFGINLQTGYHRYKEPNGEVHSRTIRGSVYVIDFGVKYLLSKK